MSKIAAAQQLGRTVVAFRVAHKRAATNNGQATPNQKKRRKQRKDALFPAGSNERQQARKLLMEQPHLELGPERGGDRLNVQHSRSN